MEVPTPATVATAREAVHAADAIWIFSPVYNFSIPGSVRNLFDWLSRALDLSDPSGPSALNGKITTVSIVANGGHEQTAADYRTFLTFIRTNFVDTVTTSKVNDTAWVDGKFIASEETLTQLNKQAEALLSAIN